MRTIYVSIGNSDDKLSQGEWSRFHAATDLTVRDFADRIHFAGSSPTAAPHQNSCWIFDQASMADELVLHEHLVHLAKAHNQESIAWAVLGPVTFILPTP